MSLKMFWLEYPEDVQKASDFMGSVRVLGFFVAAGQTATDGQGNVITDDRLYVWYDDPFERLAREDAELNRLALVAVKLKADPEYAKAKTIKAKEMYLNAFHHVSSKDAEAIIELLKPEMDHTLGELVRRAARAEARL